MANFPGPYGVEVNYTVGGLDHKMLLSVDVAGAPVVGADPLTIDFNLRGGGTVSMVTGLNDLVALLVPRYEVAAAWGVCDLYKYEAASFDRTWISTHDVADIGEHGSAYVPASYEKYSFRTSAGGIMYLQLMEISVDSNDQDPYATLSGAGKDIMDYVTSTGNWIYARDNSYPVASLRRSSGRNEATWRQRFR